MQKIVSHFETQKHAINILVQTILKAGDFLMPDREQIYIEYVDKVRRYVKGRYKTSRRLKIWYLPFS